MQLNYSFIIPVFNRPEEVKELLQSMTLLNFDRDYEVVIIEDGSSIPCDEVVDSFSKILNISYFRKGNTGPGDSRNFGMKKATGNYFLILDSDVILPPDYLKEVEQFLSNKFYDCFGGPDEADESFTNLQKSINYSMTSFLTTGGIRGSKNAVGKFQPRSFNMGFSKKALETSGGFGNIHPGEDPDLSLRLEKLGFQTVLIPDAKVYHKRRIDWSKFYTQVNKFGKVRPILNQWHPGSSKITYWLPSIFLIGFLLAIFLLLWGIPFLFLIYFLYLLILGLDAGIKNKSFNIGVTAVIATLIQFWGYGSGFLKSTWKLYVLKLNPKTAFPELFFEDAK